MSQHASLPPHAALSRRTLFAGAALGLAVAPWRQAAAAPETGMTVTEALRQRRSTRRFSDQPVEPAMVAELLWAAFGINRPETGLHTAPSWHGAADSMIHVASAEGVSVYEPEGDTTRQRHAGDIRQSLSPQPFVATAPICLLHISDLRRLSAAEDESQRPHYAQIDAAIVAQNVYLFAASRGLGTCLVGGMDRPGITAALGLEAHEYVAFVQPVGWPAEG